MSQHKKLIVLCDGTWLKRTDALLHGVQLATGIENRSNIALLAQTLKKHDADGVPQVALYQPGVGTSIGLAANIVAGATGTGLIDNLVEAYCWLIDNYAEGDQIFLFGFSRGAYIARALSGLIAYCGILSKSRSGFVTPIITAYTRRSAARPDLCRLSAEIFHHFTKQWPGYEAIETEKARVKAFYPFITGDDELKQYWTIPSGQPRVVPPPIKAIGVFDTVGALGLPGLFDNPILRDRFDFFDTTLSSNVQYAYQALALHEDRADFRPTLWEVRSDAKHSYQVVKQVWFKGSHPDVGGGFYEHGLSDITLAWMVAQMMDHNEGPLLLFNKELIARTQDRTRPWAEQPPHPTRLPIMFRKVREVLATPPPEERSERESVVGEEAKSGKAIDSVTLQHAEPTNESVHYSVTVGTLSLEPELSPQFAALRKRNPTKLRKMWELASDPNTLLPTERELRWEEPDLRLQPLSITYGRIYGYIPPRWTFMLTAFLMLTGAIKVMIYIWSSYILQFPARIIAFLFTFSTSTENLMFVPPPNAREELQHAILTAKMAWDSLLSPDNLAVEYGLEPMMLAAM